MDSGLSVDRRFFTLLTLFQQSILCVFVRHFHSRVQCSTTATD